MLDLKRFNYIYFGFLILFMSFMPPTSHSEEILVDMFDKPSSWRFIGDDVMGGLSTGSISFEKDKIGNTVGCLKGLVSTANNGGFIQMRREIDKADRKKIKDASAIILEASGNNDEYFVHLRTKGMLMPWTYYYAPFVATKDSRELIFPLSKFKRSGRFLGREFPRGAEIKSLGIVAYGKDYEAELCVNKVSFVKTSVDE